MSERDIKDNDYSPEIMYSISELEKKVTDLSIAVSQLQKQIKSVDNRIILNNERDQLLLWQLYRAGGENEKAAKIRFFKSLPQATGNLRKMQNTGFVLLREFDKICRDNDINYWLGFGTLLGAIRHGGFIPWDDDVDVCMLRSDFDRLKLVMHDNEDFICYEIFGLHGPKRCVLNHGFKIRFKNIGTPCTLDIFIFDDSRELTTQQVDTINNLKADMGIEAQNVSMNPGKDEQWNVRCRSDSKEFVECELILKAFLDRYFELLKNSSGKRKLIWAIDNLILGWGNKRQIPYEYVFPLVNVKFEGHSFLSPRCPDDYLSIMYGDYLSIPDDMISHKHFVISERQQQEYEKIKQKFL